jgi:membrane protease YdiL (CAAX protease family)
LLLFAGLAYGWSWILLVAAIMTGGSATESPASLLRLAAGIGPFVGAVVLTSDRRGLLRRIAAWRPIGWRGLGMIVVGAAGPAVAGWLVVERSDAALGVEGWGAASGVVVFALAAGIAEEPGWRGHALDVAPAAWTRLTTALVIGVVWGLWHLPLYALEGTFQHDEVGFASALFWLFAAGFLVQSVLMLWIVEQSRGSILAAVLFHALVNVSGEALELSTGAQLVRLACWVAAAGLVVSRWRRAPA